MKVAFIFPGQGSQYVGMGKDIYEQEPVVANIFNEADDILHHSLSKLCFYGPESELTLTANAQPAILIVSYALWYLLNMKGLETDCVAGHSLGEYTALISVDSLKYQDAVILVRKRGLYMQEAVAAGEGAMAAIIGLEHKTVEKICLEELKDEVVSPANYNAQDQIVISGLKDAVLKASEIAKKMGAKRVIPLKVSAPFHCKLMKPAEDKLRNDIEKVVFRDAIYPIFSNVEAKMTVKSNKIKENLIKQVTAPVKWYQIIIEMVENGIDTFVEIGPGKVLTGLVKRISPGSKVYNIQDRKSLDEVFDALT